MPKIKTKFRKVFSSILKIYRYIQFIKNEKYIFTFTPLNEIELEN